MRAVVVPLLLGMMLAGCSNETPPRLLVLALDGLDPDTVALLLSEGKLPNFARLEREGVSGRLASARPLLSPVLWTTIATGKTPDQHGIGHFVAVSRADGAELPVTSSLRRVKALWNIFSERGRKVAVVGWWASWPPEDVHGAVVSDHAAYHFLFPEGLAGRADLHGTTHPADLAATIAPLLRRPQDVGLAELSRFATVSPDELARPFRFDDDLSHLRWALAAAESHRAIGRALWRRERPDLALIYIEATDSVSHLFGHLFRTARLAGELAAQQRKYGRAVEEIYRWADEMVGECVEDLDDETTLVVLSDHGFALGELPEDPSATRTLRRVSERYHREEGVLYLYGAAVKKGKRLDRPGILDVAPTLLALAGLPPARDMPGRVLREALADDREPPRISSHEGGGSPARAAAPRDPAAETAQLERLRSLGYLDGVRSPAGERNLAGLLVAQGRLAEAAALYRRLAAERPDEPALKTSLAAVLGAMGRLADARRELAAALALDPLSPEAHHNLAVLHEQEGRRAAAIAEYRAALTCAPGYEPARRALERLSATAVLTAPRDEAERRAAALAERAEEAARRGDYAAALAALAAAERLAPGYVVLYQYRANVAYLQGDLPAAIAALEKALTLAPDNVLYRENLRRLEPRVGNAARTQPP